MSIMSPKDQPQDNNDNKDKELLRQTTNSSQEQIDTAFGEQSDNRSDLESNSNSVDNKSNPNNRRVLMKNQIFGFDMPFDVISVAFASTVALGGVMGYVKAKSTYSLIAGLVFGGVLGYGAYQTSVNPRNYYLTLGTSALLGSFMGYRAFNSGKFMPAGLVATLSLLMVIRFTVRAITDTNYVKK